MSGAGMKKDGAMGGFARLGAAAVLALALGGCLGGLGGGKSSIAEALRLALTGDWLLRGLTRKQDRAALLSDGAEAGSIVVEAADGFRAAVNIKTGKVERTPGPVAYLEQCCDPRLIVDQPTADLREMLIYLLQIDTGRIGMQAELIARGHDPDRVGAWVCGQDCATAASEARGAWKAATGEVYGMVKAAAWTAPKPGFDPDELARVDAEHTKQSARLAALRAFLKFAARRDVTALHDIERALAVPMKRFERPMLGFLTRIEMLAVLGQPGETWSSQRDHLLLAMLYNTGARVSEMIGVRVVDVILDGGACVHLHGKGRKLRSIPLWKSTVLEIRAWLRLNPVMRGEAALLPNRDGQAMCRSNVTQRLSLAVTRAKAEQPSLANKRVSPHTLRHTSAMHLLQSGVPFNVIALWLGHESTTTTHRYVEADLAMKERALARLEEPDTKMGRYKAPDSLLRFLQTL